VRERDREREIERDIGIEQQGISRSHDMSYHMFDRVIWHM